MILVIHFDINGQNSTALDTQVRLPDCRHATPGVLKPVGTQGLPYYPNIVIDEESSFYVGFKALAANTLFGRQSILADMQGSR